MDAADQNYARSVAVFSGCCKTGEAVDALDYVLGNTRGPLAFFNSAFLKRPGYKVERAVDRLLAYYARAGVPFRVHVASEEGAAIELLQARGLAATGPVPVMQLAGARCEAAPVAGLEIRRVGAGAGEAPLSDFQRVAFESFGLPPELGAVSMTAELRALPGVQQFVGYLEGEPACCSVLLVTGTMAGLYWVGTLEPHRKRGLGAAVTAHAVAAGRALGCTEACLQASSMGAPVYAALGFVTIRQYASFDGPAAAATAS